VRILRDPDHPFSPDSDRWFSRQADRCSAVKAIGVLPLKTITSGQPGHKRSEWENE
jgi:hypothetical protein